MKTNTWKDVAILARRNGHLEWARIALRRALAIARKA